MYTLEERQRAVDLYLRYGRKASIVIRELGYPDRKMLTKWTHEFEEEGRLHEKPRIGNACVMSIKNGEKFHGNSRKISKFIPVDLEGPVFSLKTGFSNFNGEKFHTKFHRGFK